MDIVHGLLKWGWCMGVTGALALIYFQWLLNLERGALAIAAICILVALSCAIGELCLTFGGFNG